MMTASATLRFFGALCGFVATVGLVVMSVVFVGHARRIGELRRWAGDRPERDAEARQRVAAIARQRSEYAVLRQAQRGRAIIRVREIMPRVAACGALLGAIAVIVTLVTSDPFGHSSRAGHRGRWSSAHDPQPGQVRVLNAAGVAGLAMRAAEQLRRAGLVVVGVDDAPPRAVTRIEAGTDDRPAAVRVLRALEVRRVRRVGRKDAARGVDIVVTIGSDAATSSALG